MGTTDAQGVYHVAETDTAATASDLFGLVTHPISTALGKLAARLARLEEPPTLLTVAPTPGPVSTAAGAVSTTLPASNPARLLAWSGDRWAELRGAVNRASGTWSAGDKLMSLPAGMRSATDQHVYGPAVTQGGLVNVRVTGDGVYLDSLLGVTSPGGWLVVMGLIYPRVP